MSFCAFHIGEHQNSFNQDTDESSFTILNSESESVSGCFLDTLLAVLEFFALFEIV